MQDPYLSESKQLQQTSYYMEETQLSPKVNINITSPGCKHEAVREHSTGDSLNYFRPQI